MTWIIQHRQELILVGYIAAGATPIWAWLFWHPLFKKQKRSPDMQEFFIKSGLSKKPKSSSGDSIQLLPSWSYLWYWDGTRFLPDGVIINTKGFAVDLSEGSDWFCKNRGMLQNAADLKLTELPEVKADLIIWKRSKFYTKGGKKNG